MWREREKFLSENREREVREFLESVVGEERVKESFEYIKKKEIMISVDGGNGVANTASQLKQLKQFHMSGTWAILEVCRGSGGVCVYLCVDEGE